MLALPAPAPSGTPIVTSGERPIAAGIELQRAGNGFIGRRIVRRAA